FRISSMRAAPLVWWLVVLLAGCSQRSGPVTPPPAPEMQRLESLMHLGLAAFEIGQNKDAEGKFDALTRQAPREPAGWANRGLARLRQGQADRAAPDIQKALSMAPSSARVEMLAAALESARGNEVAALEHLRRAVKDDPADVKARWALVEHLERAPGAGTGA